MSKFKIFFNKQEPSSDEINNSKDFDSVKRRIDGQPAVKNFRNGAIAAVGAALIGVGALVYFATNTSNQEKTISETANGQDENLVSVEKAISDVVEAKFDVEIPNEKFMINPNETTHIVTNEGTIIHIPAYSFVTESGEPVEDEVEVQFTPMNEPLSVYLSGVSMTYDTNGTKYAFQSGGMFELLASSRDLDVKIDADKELTVYHPSTVEDDDLNVYHMDSRDGDWTYEDKSEKLDFAEVCEKERIVFEREDEEVSKELLKVENDLSTLTKDVSSLETKEIIEPHRFNPNNYTFDLDIDPIEFPELKAFENVKFEVTDKGFRHYHYDKVWDNLQLKKNADESYSIDLYEGNDKTTFKVFPVLRPAELEKAMKKYENELAMIESQIDEKNEEIYRLEDYLKDKKKEAGRQMKIKSKNAMVSTFRNSVREGMTMRRFSVRNLGIVNADKPYVPNKSAHPFGADFLVNKIGLQVFAITVVNLSRNVFIELTEKDFSKLKLNPGKKHMAFGKNREGKLVVLGVEDFKVIRSKESHYQFDMKIIDVAEDDYEGIKEAVDQIMNS